VQSPASGFIVDSPINPLQRNDRIAQ